ncbi:MAG: DnaD domain protein [Bacilli bacterium]
MRIIEKDSMMSLYSDFTLSATDEQVLSLLYLPIIKSDAFSLFEIFHSLSLSKAGNGCFQHELVQSLLGIEDIKFIDACEHLEAVGLLETYRKENSEDKTIHYVYKLIPPATPKKFFDDVLLRSSLCCFVNQKTYISLKTYFKITPANINDSYKNISSKFKEVYSLDLSESENAIVDNGNLNIEKNYKCQSSFSFKKMMELIKKDGFNIRTISEYESRIKDICVLFGISESECAQLAEKNTSTDDVFVFSGFSSDAKKLKKYSVVRNNITDDEYYGNSETSKYLMAFTTIIPKDYLSIRLNGEPAKFMTDEIIKLHNDLNLNDSVINVVLDYSLKKTNGEFNCSFIEKVAYTLADQNVTSAYQAMSILNSRDFEKNKAKNKKKNIVKTNESAKDNSDESHGVSNDEFEDLKKDFDL